MWMSGDILKHKVIVHWKVIVIVMRRTFWGVCTTFSIHATPDPRIHIRLILQEKRKWSVLWSFGFSERERSMLQLLFARVNFCLVCPVPFNFYARFCHNRAKDWEIGHKTRRLLSTEKQISDLLLFSKVHKFFQSFSGKGMKISNTEFRQKLSFVIFTFEE